MKYAFLVCALFLVACAQELPQKEVDERIEILYEHTRIMLSVTSPQDAQAIGLDVSAWRETSDRGEQLVVVEHMMGLSSSGSESRRVVRAEEKMASLMELWRDTPSAKV